MINILLYKVENILINIQNEYAMFLFVFGVFFFFIFISMQFETFILSKILRETEPLKISFFITFLSVATTKRKTLCKLKKKK